VACAISAKRGLNIAHKLEYPISALINILQEQ